MKVHQRADDTSFGVRYQFTRNERRISLVPTLTFRRRSHASRHLQPGLQLSLPGLRSAALEPEILLAQALAGPALVSTVTAFSPLESYDSQ